MTCTISHCKAEFCWDCLEFWKPHHANPSKCYLEIELKIKCPFCFKAVPRLNNRLDNKCQFCSKTFCQLCKESFQINDSHPSNNVCLKDKRIKDQKALSMWNYLILIYNQSKLEKNQSKKKKLINNQQKI